MKEEFNLSEKIGLRVYRDKARDFQYILLEDVKEFIKRLKENINDYWTNGEGQCICPDCWEHRESDEKRIKDCMFLRIFKEIDKLAGNDLI